MTTVNFEILYSSIECAVCNDVLTQTHPLTKTQTLNFMNKHEKCEGMSFKCESYVSPIIEKPFEFCFNMNGEERFGVYVCAHCEYVLHKVRKS